MDYNFANMNKESLEILTNAEKQIKQQSGDNVVLVAYEKEHDENNNNKYQ